jgi:hypothetical protein
MPASNLDSLLSPSDIHDFAAGDDMDVPVPLDFILAGSVKNKHMATRAYFRNGDYEGSRGVFELSVDGISIGGEI